MNVTIYISTSISFKDLRLKSGTKHFSAGYPTGKSSTSFSEVGLLSRVRKAGPQFNGVDVKETNPAYLAKY